MSFYSVDIPNDREQFNSNSWKPPVPTVFLNKFLYLGLVTAQLATDYTELCVFFTELPKLPF